MSEIKTVLITGASTGIGKSLALEFAARGKNLVLLARREDLLIQLKHEIENRFSVKVFVAAADVVNAEKLHAAVKKANEVLGDIDTVIANAGFGVNGDVADLRMQDFEKQFDVNVFGVLKTFYATLENLKKTKGRLCLIGSAVSYFTTPNTTAYCMSKYAIRSLAEGLHAELASDGISVTLINPGLIDTGIRKNNNDGVFDEKNKDPAPRFLMMNAQVAARKIANAIQSRKRERAITIHGQLSIWIARFLPGVVAFVLRKTRKKS